MSDLTMLENIRKLSATEAAKGNGVVALWFNWNRYRARPAWFTKELNTSRRDDAAAILNDLWNKHGVATVVYRGTQIRGDLAADRTAWLVQEVQRRIGLGELAAFASILCDADAHPCRAVVVLADQDFVSDGQSDHEITDRRFQHRVVMLDPEERLPNGLSPLIDYDSDIRHAVHDLECNLVERWLKQHEAGDSQSTQVLHQLCDHFCSQFEPVRARRLAGLNTGNSRQPLTSEDKDSIRARIIADLTKPPPPRPDGIRLADRIDGPLNWFLPRDGKVSLSSGRLFLLCFGRPRVDSLKPDSWMLALMNDATPQERNDLRSNNALEVAVATMRSLYAAMRIANVFAHRDEYLFDLPIYVLDAMLRNEVENLRRMHAAWGL